MSNYFDRFEMASCPLEVQRFLDSKRDQNIPLWSEICKGNILQNTPLQSNGRQSQKSEDDMNDWCVKTNQDRKDHGFVELIYKFQGLEKYQSIFEWL